MGVLGIEQISRVYLQILIINLLHFCFDFIFYYLGHRLKGEASKAVREGRCAGNCDCEQIQVKLFSGCLRKQGCWNFTFIEQSKLELY